MRLHTSLHVWSTALFTTLGMTPFIACGGTTVGRDGDNLVDAGPRGSGGKQGGTGGFVPGDGGDWPLPGSGGLPGAGGGLPNGSGGELPHYLPSCANPVPHLGFDGKPTGFLDCIGEGTQLRLEPAVCSTKLPRATGCWIAATGADGGNGMCHADSDCTEHANGRCDPVAWEARCGCRYGCVQDSDCPAGNLCQCGDPVGRCIPATCTRDTDCGGGVRHCLSYHEQYGATGFACVSPTDRCVADSQCEPGMECDWKDGERACDYKLQIVDGRPFLVGGAARVAERATRGDWASSTTPDVGGLCAADRAVLAEHWTEVALMEHASIAAFARFALELLSLGAPPSLVQASTVAMADETRHARDAFAFASAYAGKDVGPGKLDVDAALSSRTPFDVVRTTILEGCIGETVAAVEAAEALARATDPAVRAALSRVTREETQHAELAWRFVQWVLDEGSAELREVTARELVRIVEAECALACRPEERAPGVRSAALVAHGSLGDDERRWIRRRVLEDVVLPCARAMTARATPALRAA